MFINREELLFNMGFLEDKLDKKDLEKFNKISKRIKETTKKLPYIKGEDQEEERKQFVNEFNQIAKEQVEFYKKLENKYGIKIEIHP